MSSDRSPTRSDMGTDRSRRRVVVVSQPDVAEAGEFVALFVDTDVEVELVETESEDDVRDAVAQAIEDGADTIASVGGDGALNLIAGALASIDEVDTADGGPRVVPVRAGTVNLVSKTLGLDSPETTADAVIADRHRPIDIGSTDQGPFVLNASSGYDAAVIDDAHDHSDARFGQLQFLKAGLSRLRRSSPTRVAVTCDGDVVFDGRAMSVIVMNIGQRASEKFDVAPDAEFDDGLLDVAIVRADSIPRFAVIVARLALGRPVDRSALVRAQAERIDVEWSRPVASQRDGDADDPIRTLSIRVRPKTLRIHHA